MDEPVAMLSTSIDTLWVLVCAFLVFFMNTGFGCVESGFCRSKNAVNILAKNFIVFGIASIGFWAVGFALMFGDGGSFFGTNGWFLMGADNSPATGDAYQGVFSALSWAGVPFNAKFFFQLAFAGTAATIVSGCVAERIHYTSFMIFALVIAAIGYPVTGHWIWGGGWLQQLGMWDFAGSTVVHSVGGWAGLAGILVLGPRIGKYRKDGTVSPIPGHSMPLAFIGAMILWLGWFGFNPGSTMAIAGDGGVAASHIVVTTNIACAAGLIVATLVSVMLFGKPDFSMTVNGALAGLVSVTAACAFVTIPAALLIGAIGGLLVVYAVRFFDSVRIDDPVGALAVHLVCGVWGTFAVGLFATTDAPGGISANGLFYGGGFELLKAQVIGIAAVGAFTFVGAYAAWYALKVTLSIRVAPTVESEGLDVHEMGSEAYPHESAIDVAELIKQSRLGRHEHEIVRQEAIRSPRSAEMPPEFSVYKIRLSDVDLAAFLKSWKEMCGANSGISSDFQEIYRHFTTLETGGEMRFRGGNPEHVREKLQSLAAAINPRATADLIDTKTHRLSAVM
ncbi:MAG: ammonium transporter [bacterium]|nr:ammonium transporter [bacterium]